MRKGAIIILVVLMAALFVSDVSAIAVGGTITGAEALGIGRHSAASTFNAAGLIAVDNTGGRDIVATGGIAAARARGGDSAYARSGVLSAGLAW